MSNIFYVFVNMISSNYHKSTFKKSKLSIKKKQKQKKIVFNLKTLTVSYIFSNDYFFFLSEIKI